MIEIQDDVCTKLVLNANGVLRTQVAFFAAAMRAELHTVVIDLADASEGKHLVATGIGDHGQVPRYKSMDAARFSDEIFAWMEMEVIGVAQENLRSKTTKVFMGETLHSAGSSHRHEQGQGKIAVKRAERSQTANGCRLLQGEHRRRIPRVLLAQKRSLTRKPLFCRRHRGRMEKHFFPLCPMCWSSCCCGAPKKVSKMLVRISFGLSLAFVGISHYRQIALFSGMTQQDLGVLAPVGALWGYILPALMIVGGVLYVVGMLPQVAVWCAGLAIGSIPAGMLLKSALTGASLAETMPAAETAFIWAIAFMMVSKSGWTCCSKSCTCSAKGCCCGNSCGCDSPKKGK